MQIVLKHWEYTNARIANAGIAGIVKTIYKIKTMSEMSIDLHGISLKQAMDISAALIEFMALDGELATDLAKRLNDKCQPPLVEINRNITNIQIVYKKC